MNTIIQYLHHLLGNKKYNLSLYISQYKFYKKINVKTIIMTTTKKKKLITFALIKKQTQTKKITNNNK